MLFVNLVLSCQEKSMIMTLIAMSQMTRKLAKIFILVLTLPILVLKHHNLVTEIMLHQNLHLLIKENQKIRGNLIDLAKNRK